MKKQEVPLKEFLQSREYEIINSNIKSLINNNNVMFNTGSKFRDDIKFTTNLINHKEMQESFVKSPEERNKLRDFKQLFKSKSFDVINQLLKAKEQAKAQILSYSLNMPNSNIVFINK
jgi:adenylylsulfate kinase-like enzyme